MIANHLREKNQKEMSLPAFQYSSTIHSTHNMCNAKIANDFFNAFHKVFLK
jgi:hypothetical protein